MRKTYLALPFAICEVRGMDASPTKFAEAAGISVSYASEILSGARVPSQRLAISIFRKTGRKFGPVSNLADGDIDMLERLQELSAQDQAA